MVADIFWAKTPTLHEPSSVMPSFVAGVEPLKVQLNLVPLYLPATISPGPLQSPSTLWKNLRSRSAAWAEAASPAVAAEAARTGRIADRITRFIEGHPAT